MKFFVTALIFSTLFSAGAFAQANRITDPVAIDFASFIELSIEVKTYREDRLISKDEFLKMANDPQTVILDTRSKIAYDLGHIEGAIHLNFSDFTDTKLKQYLSNKDVRVLIYCNNNFTNNLPPFQTKKIELALNIPTFINLYGYGYKNIYELKDGVDMRDPELNIVGTMQQ